MTIVAILSLLLGAVLGHRFKVFVLVPTVAIGSAVAIGVGFAEAVDVWLIVLTVTLAVVCLQIGYLCGAILVSLAVASRATRIKARKVIFKQVGHGRSHRIDVR